jgi:transcription antitermination factor NusG
MNTGKRWLAVYTKPRWEKKIYRLLTEKGVETYCPLNKVHSKWSDRVKLVEEPLFKSYVFVHITKDEEENVKRVNGILNFVYWLGKPAEIKPKDIERIKRFLNDYQNVSAEQLALKPNDMVMINSGAFMEKQGKVLRKLGNRVELEIESLGFKLVAYIDKNKVTVISNNK